MAQHVHDKSDGVLPVREYLHYMACSVTLFGGLILHIHASARYEW